MKNHEVFVNKSDEVTRNFRMETPKNIRMVEFVCLRSEMYSFKRGIDIKNKLKSIFKSQSKHKNFEEFKNV